MNLVRQSGAAVGVDYSEQEWAARVRAEIGALHAVFDGHIGTACWRGSQGPARCGFATKMQIGRSLA
jgi:hypothetical protein